MIWQSEFLSIYVKTRTILLQQFIKMCMVGFSGMLLQFLIFNLLRSVLSPTWSIEMATFVAIINNFYFHGRLTFNHAGFRLNNLVSKTGFMFLTYSLLMIVLQGQWMKWTIGYLGDGHYMENLMMFAGMIWGSTLNFICYRYVIWPAKMSVSA